MFITILFIINKNKYIWSLSISEWIHKWWCIQTVEYYSVLKRNNLSSHERTWRNREYMWPSERNQSQKAVYRVISTLWHSGKGRTISGGSDSKESACNMGDPGSTPGSGRSPREGNGNPLQYSCLETPMDIGASWAAVHGVAKSRIWLKRLSTCEWT